MIAEQEKREKAMIEKILSDEQIKIANDTNEFAKLQKLGISICYADALYDAGYRKEEEVREEILREVINFIKENRYCTIDDELIEEAYKRFGMEVADEK